MSFQHRTRDRRTKRQQRPFESLPGLTAGQQQGRNRARRRPSSGVFVAALVLASLWQCGTADEPPPRPNIIVIVTDDQGYADLGVQGIREDVKTPQLDRLAHDGVRCTRGFVTAAQCRPSRAGLITGRYQNRFGISDYLAPPLPHSERTIADRLRAAGYATGMVGKWQLNVDTTPATVAGGDRSPTAGTGRRPAPRHLPEHLPGRHGFEEYFCGSRSRYHASHDLSGQKLDPAANMVTERGFRVDVQTQAAVSYIDRHATDPFFLFVSYYAPHVPLEAPPEYLDRFPDIEDDTRRTALAMIAAVDDGVGRLRSRLEAHGIARRTLIFFLSDNGATLGRGARNGSLNDPLVGEKGMLTDGGIRVPYLVCWPDALPGGQIYEKSVSALDITATALAAAGVDWAADGQLDGVDLVPYLSGENSAPPHAELYWQQRGQAALLSGEWKYLALGDDHEFLFNMSRADGEKVNLIAEHGQLAVRLRGRLETWCKQFPDSNLPDEASATDLALFRAHYELSR